MISECVLQGERVRLRPVEERDLPLFVRWLRDPEVRYWLFVSETPEPTLESEREWYAETRSDPSRIVWCIEAEEGQTIGNVALQDIDETHGHASLGICIGERPCWGRGYGTEAVRAVLRYAFREMGLRRVFLFTDEDNQRAVRAFQKCGFVREGLLRAHRLRRGRPVNGLVMGILREEFEAQPWS